MIEPLRPVSVKTRPTVPGRVLLVVTAMSLGMAWAGAGIWFSLVAMLGTSLCVVTALSGRRHASALRIAAPAPVTAFAGEHFSIDVQVVNFARRAIAFDVLFAVSPRHAFGDPVGAFLPRLAAGEETHVDVVYPKLRRGLHPQGTLKLSSTFPVGLFSCRVLFALPHPILVLPRLGTVRHVDCRGRRLRGDAGSRGSGGGDEQEVYGVRAWRNGESLRSVHWKLSARRGRLLVREFRNEPRPPIQVVLATDVAEDSRFSRKAFEEAVSFAATLVEHHVRRGHAVRLTLRGRELHTVPCRRGRGAVFPALRALAEVAPEFGVRALFPPCARVRRGEKTYLVRVGPESAVEPSQPSRRSSVEESATVFDVTDVDIVGAFDRRRRPGSEMLLGVRA